MPAKKFWGKSRYEPRKITSVQEITEDNKTTVFNAIAWGSVGALAQEC